MPVHQTSEYGCDECGLEDRHGVIYRIDGQIIAVRCRHHLFPHNWIEKLAAGEMKLPRVQSRISEPATLNDEAATDAAIQAKGLSAPRVTPDMIDAAIVGETFTVLPSGKAMVCELTLRNGFIVRGEASVVSKTNFDEEIGRRVSRENARKKVWELEGYLLQQRLHMQERDEVAKITDRHDQCRVN